MRRAVPVIAATAGALALLANFHTSPGGARLAAGAPGALGTTSSQPSISSSSPSTTAGPTGGSTPTTAATRTIDGPAIGTKYGVVQVRVVLQGSQIVDVEPLALPFDRGKSLRISQQAGPLLRTEALQAQSARINVVSGASYTSDAYAQSLQAALDSAGA
jgi:uncharacterized protein with FMN-binding domain